MQTNKERHDNIRDRGESDFNEGKPIGAFYDIPGVRPWTPRSKL